MKQREREKNSRRLFQEVHRHVKMGVVRVSTGNPKFVIGWRGEKKDAFIHFHSLKSRRKILLLLHSFDGVSGK